MIYRAERNYILKLLKCAVSDNIPSAPSANLDWEQIFIYAKKHRILPTLYFGLQKLPESEKKHIPHFEQYQLTYQITLVQDANRNAETEMLKNRFEAVGIDYIFLKGSVTKHLYPDTAMRVMNDIDILYRNADTRTIQNIFIQSNYKLAKKEPKELAFINAALKVKIEMQTQLIDEGYKQWFAYLNNMWDKCTAINNSHEYKMTDEDFYIYHIIHMAKHFKNGGIGLTHVLDIQILLNTYKNLNRQYINYELSSIGLDVFEEKIRLLSSVWFGNAVPHKDDFRTLELLESYIFAGGAFGAKSQQEINNIIARNAGGFSLIRKIFPSPDEMVDYYGSFLKKHPYLLPVYWIRLNFNRIFFNRKNSTASFKIMRQISKEPIRLTQELMNNLKL